MKKAREVIRVFGLGNKIRFSAKAAKLSRTAATNIIEKVQLCGLSIDSLLALNDHDLKKIIYPQKENIDPKYKKLQELLPEIIIALGKKHETTQNLWEQYINENLDGYSYSQFCHHILKVQKTNPQICAVFNYKYGDLMFIDYAGDPVSYTGLDGVEVFVKVFVAILPASQYTYAGLSKRETTEEWIEQSTRAVEYIGGISAAIIPDCAKAVVNKAEKYESEINRQYSKFAEHYGMTVVPARPYSPRDKALVENTVNNIYRYIYPRLRAKNCVSFEELELCFSELLEKYNNRVMRRYNKSRKELFVEHESSELRTLNSTRYVFHKHQCERKVGSTSHIYLKEDQHYYSIPERYTGRKCEIYYTISLVKIFCDNERICVHPREMGIGRYTTEPEHLPNKLRHYLLFDPEKAKRKAREYGVIVESVVDNIFNEQAHHLQARKSVYGIFNLASKYKKERFLTACNMATREGVGRYAVIKNILERGLDKSESDQLPFDYEDIDHKNLRHTNKENNDDERTNSKQDEVA